MAGVVAMASVIEDFEAQPCKKPRKDGDSPVVKTITSYFSPVPKPLEKPFSPPRPNSIMDYFSRRTLSSKEKSSSLEESKGNCQRSQSAEKHTSLEAAVKPASHHQPSGEKKRGRKATKAARKLVEVEAICSAEEDSCVIVEDSHENTDSVTESTSICGVFGSDTAALLAQLSAETCITSGISGKNDTNTVSVELTKNDEHHESASKCGNHVKHGPELLKNSASSPVVPSKLKAQQVRPSARTSRKCPQQEAKLSEPEEEEAENSMCDVSMEVNVDEASQLNNSTVMISFEDFVRSQSQDEEEDDIEDKQCNDDESKITKEAEDIDHLDTPKAEVSSVEISLQVSPRTVTIQAEVHAVSPKQEAVKPVGRLASIFNRGKGTIRPAEVTSSPHPDSGLPSMPLNVKRKSNVVLQEEDLELAVLESESTPRCSESERKQFMAAFKQPSLDGSKVKPCKGKQRELGERTLDAADQVAVDDTEIQETKAALKKPARKGRKKAEAEQEVVPTSPVDVTPVSPVEETVATNNEVDDKREEFVITSSPSIPAVRRSSRGAVVRQAPKASPPTHIKNTRKQDRLKDAAASPPDNLIKKSTPMKRKSKHGVYVAEMICPPGTKESPFRIKFTKVHQNVSTAGSGSGINSHLTSKTSNDSKKRKKAKKLVEKAIAIQQSKKAAVEVKSRPRRSSRTEAFIKKSYCENEDSVICLEEDHTDNPQTKPQKGKTQKLRSLNDVLGKATSLCKETKNPLGLLGQEKNAQRVSAVVSIFDESSHEASENSQDDEQFRARRDFLKSGLPESFRKQIAKAAANREAYTLSCCSFQPVIHVTQQPKGCPLWSLPWPESSLLCHFKELWNQVSIPPLCVSGSFGAKREPAPRVVCERGSGWRPEISANVRQLLLEEISTSNPPFPSQSFITRFLARRTDHQQHCSASEAVTRSTSTLPSVEPVGGKRKRTDDQGVKVAKKQRATHSEEKTSMPETEPTKRGGRTRRAQKARLEEEEAKEMPSSRTAPILPEDDSVVVLDDLLLREDTGKKDAVKEDVLWTDKYQPQHSSDIIGNTAAVRRLHSWLKEWKLRADREERNKQKVKKQEQSSNDSDWDCGEEDSQCEDDSLCNTILITGPTGVGKTATVYACAQELGFKVFEVNASSQRSGRLILSQLKEATQSHQVDSQGVNAHKPTYFNSYGTSSSAGTVKHRASPRKVNSPRRVVSSPRKPPQSPRAAKRGGLAPTSLANFFKTGKTMNKDPINTKEEEQKAASKKIKENEGVSKHKEPEVKSPTAATPKETSEEQSKKTATSLILFEEVDVIFDDDSGFLAAIKTFMTTTKRPVILTTSDPAFSNMFDGNFEEIHFKTPSVLDVSSYLRLLCLAENMRTDRSDVSSLLRLNDCDIRRSILQLQYWTRSAGGRHIPRPLPLTEKSAEQRPHEEAADMSVGTVTIPSTLPPCDTACTEGILGLLNIEPERDMWELLRNQVKELACWQLLMESNRRGVNLLYSNMETLLPLPLTKLACTHKREKCVSVSQDNPSVNASSSLLPDQLPAHARLLHSLESGDCSDDGSPVKVSHRMRKNKRRHCLPDQDGLHSDSDSGDSFLSLCKSQRSPQAKEENKERLVSERMKRKPLTHEERLKSLPVSQCLDSIGDFLDSMSYMDSSLLVCHGGDIHRRNSPVHAAVKDGMTDESRVEIDRLSWGRREGELEIQAAVEALSFHKCQLAVAEAWDKAQQLKGELGKEAAAELTLPVASHHEGSSFTQDSPCQPQLVQRRRNVMESLMFRGVFGTLGNRPAAALDYLPVLRTICRSEQLKEQGKVKRRFLHYLDSIHLGLDKGTLQHLAEDFP